MAPQSAPIMVIGSAFKVSMQPPVWNYVDWFDSFGANGNPELLKENVLKILNETVDLFFNHAQVFNPKDQQNLVQFIEHNESMYVVAGYARRFEPHSVLANDGFNIDTIQVVETQYAPIVNLKDTLSSEKELTAKLEACIPTQISDRYERQYIVETIMNALTRLHNEQFGVAFI